MSVPCTRPGSEDKPSTDSQRPLEKDHYGSPNHQSIKGRLYK
ncbi:hypothetical protein BRDCF_p1695 [Bacteroidales bacterium CF]|nr:hypothetical protein BRDCF_p1695 [Bacteroidales bacterium CF]